MNVKIGFSHFFVFVFLRFAQVFISEIYLSLIQDIRGSVFGIVIIVNLRGVCTEFRRSLILFRDLLSRQTGTKL